MNASSARWIVLTLALVVLVSIFGGCRERRASTPQSQPPTGIVSAADLPIELTYPQSDDRGNYVNLTEPGSIVVTGVVSSPQPPTRLLVNGITTRPYRVEYITPYSVQTPYPVYRFHAPVVLAPTDRIVVQVVEPVVSREIIFLPNRTAVITRYTTLYTAAPADPWLSMRLASAYYAENAFADSITYLDRALNEDNDAPWLLYNLGMSYLSLRRADMALDYFGRGVRVYPAFPDYYYGMGMTYYVTRRYDDAILNLVRASDIAPEWAEPLLALGLTYYADKRLRESVDYYDRAIAVWPYWAAPRYGLAYVYLDEGRDRDALVLLTGAERLGPWRDQHHLALAEKLYARGNYKAAWRQVQIARKLGGEAPEPLLKKLRVKSGDPGKLAQAPWAKMEGPGPKEHLREQGAGEDKRRAGRDMEGSGRGRGDEAGEKPGPDRKQEARRDGSGKREGDSYSKQGDRSREERGPRVETGKERGDRANANSGKDSGRRVGGGNTSDQGRGKSEVSGGKRGGGDGERDRGGKGGGDGRAGGHGKGH